MIVSVQKNWLIHPAIRLHWLCIFWFTRKNQLIRVIQYCDCAPVYSKWRNIILVWFSVHADRNMHVQGTLTEQNFIWLRYLKSIPSPSHHLGGDFVKFICRAVKPVVPSCCKSPFMSHWTLRRLRLLLHCYCSFFFLPPSVLKSVGPAREERYTPQTCPSRLKRV